MSGKQLAVLTSHPIQYQVPLFRALAAHLDLTVFFAHRQTPAQQAAAGYGVSFEWDIDLLSGYDHIFLRNQARHPSTSRFMGCNTPEIASIIASNPFDAFLVSGWHLLSYWHAVYACRRHSVPVLFRGTAQLGSPRSLTKRLAKELLYRWVVKQFDAFLYIGKRNLEYLVHYGVGSEKLLSAPYFVDTAWFGARARAAGLKRQCTKAKFGIPVDQPVALFVGRLLSWKRPGDILAAVAVLKKSGVTVHPVFVGSGSLDRQLETTAEELDVSITLAGFQNQSALPAFYDLADMFVLPSEANETWGLVVNEAMSCGTPAVVSDAAGCAPDLIDKGLTGYTYPVGNIDALAEAMRKTLGWKGRPTVQEALSRKMQLHSVDATVEAALEAVERLTTKQGRRESDPGE